MACTDLVAATQAWHEDRLAKLTADDGWLTLVGLHWLKEGPNMFGSMSESDIVFPANFPSQGGCLTRSGSIVSLTVASDVCLLVGGEPFVGGVVKTDADDEPHTFFLGSVSFMVIQRGDRLGVRVRDTATEQRKAFKGIPRFPTNPAWRIAGRFERFETQRTLRVPNVLGDITDMLAPGQVVFNVNGQEYHLTPVADPDDPELFFIFRDLTSSTETYGSGRFLYADRPQDGEVILDFNCAYNPPCAFTPFATCPLPPPENRLNVRIEAGEKRVGDH
eukprot:GGOE01018809.1.p1 GENE.GGOE01018809.1~~GGOE01018809.1.p1  ORF type:complete len:288 (+),score=16.02 GGOE01018809.1:39-866(+)